MIASMTGYGTATLSSENVKITIDLKSINSKQLDLILRIPTSYRDVELSMRNLLSQKLERGKVEVSVNVENLSGDTPVKFNFNTIKNYKLHLEEIIKELEIPSPQDWLSVLLRLPETTTNDTKEASEIDKDLLLKCLEEASSQLMLSRIKEGKGLYEFFFNKLERIQSFLLKTSEFETSRVEKIREKLEQQLSRLQGVDIDKGRLEQELIFYIEKLDVTEEKQRLKSHIEYFAETLGEPEEDNVYGKGKKLGFISQEMGREINTLGSKSNDAEMQKLVVMMKDELEQIKEQVLNVL